MNANILVMSLLAGLVTGLGAIVSILLKNPTKKIISLSLGFASGIMIGVSLLSLIPHSLETGDVFFTAIGFIIGGFFMWLIDTYTPHMHKDEANDNNYLKMGYFIALGIAIHNLPEGVAIGASSVVSEKLGFLTAVVIGLHNIAEGMAVALPLHMGKVAKRRIIFITTLTGLSTFFGTILGLMLVNISPLFIAFSMAFAAGAMIYIASDELIPHSHKVYSELANIGIMIGIAAAFLIP